uniref:Uncharacterized protein n=1 Tax=Anguilla anguilla TaxID=7936 RepID=A0A0E9VKS7_ANGAN
MDIMSKQEQWAKAQTLESCQSFN